MRRVKQRRHRNTSFQRRSAPDDGHPIRFENRICRYDHEIFDDGLGDLDTIEGVAVMQRIPSRRLLHPANG